MMETQEPALPVRYVLHFGEVTVGGAPTMGEESLSGPDVNFIFRLEKLAGALKQPFLCSAVVPPHLPEIAFRSVGRHVVPGFPGDFDMFALGEGPGGSGV